MYAANSLTVTIDPSEAFVDGWLARNTASEIKLATDTVGQTVVVGWDPDAIYDDQQHDTRDEADRVIVDLESNTDATHPVTAIWKFDTDDSGVVEAHDLRTIGQSIDARTIDRGTLAVEAPDRLPIAELDDGDSIEIAIPVTDGGILKVYRWGAFDISDGSAPSGLVCEILDDSDTVQATENTVDNQKVDQPVATLTNSSGNLSIFKLRAMNRTGEPINTPGVGTVFGYWVEE